MTGRKINCYALLGMVIVAKLAIVLIIIPNLHFLNQENYIINNLPDSYPKIAKNLLMGNGYRLTPDTAETMIRPPVNIFLLSAVFSVVGESLTTMQVLNILLSVSGGLLLMKLVRKRTSNPVIAWVAAAIFIFHPGMILAETRGGVEILLTFLMIIFVYILDYAFESRKARYFFLSGLVLGITGLTKSTPIIIAPFLLIYAFFWYRDHRLQVCRNVMILWLGLGLVLTPWVVRNYLISDQFVPTMTIKGAAAYQGLFLSRHGQGDGEFHEALLAAAQEQKAIARQMGLSYWDGDWLPIFYSARDEVEFDAYLFQYVIEEYARTPMLFINNVAQNTWRFWLQGRTSMATVANSIVTIPLLVLAIIGVLLSLRRRHGFEPVVLFMVVYFLAHLPLIAFAKYHVPLIPFLAVFASVTLSRPIESFLDRWKCRVRTTEQV